MKSLICFICLFFIPLPALAESMLAKTEPVHAVNSELESPIRLNQQLLSPQMLIAYSCQTGTLLFSQGDCLAVRVYTNSPYTHVALAIVEDDQIYIYDSMNDVGVRKQKLDEYLSVQSPDKVHLFQPKRPFTKEETSCLQAYLDSQLGRPYAVAHHLTGKRNEGLHCSEYVTDALMEVDWLHAKKPSRVSPASLAEGITLHNVYTSAMTIELPFEVEPTPEPTSTCGKLWLDTKLCVGKSCGKMSRWFLCR